MHSFSLAQAFHVNIKKIKIESHAFVHVFLLKKKSLMHSHMYFHRI